jgi:hypothetical protein
MSRTTQPEVHPEVAYYTYRLGYVARDLVMLANRAVEYPDIRKQLQHLTFYVRRLRWALPRDGAAIGPRWWQRYTRFYSFVEDLRHPEFDDAFDLLWIGLPETN